MDLDGDGCNDVLSGSWPGEIFLFKGGPDHAFAAGEMLKDEEGQLINIGGGIRETANMFGESETMILIAGSAEFETTDEGTFAVYHGRRIKSTAAKPVGITGTASTVHPADWDGDGDYDLIVGDSKGNVYLIPNEGTPKAHAFGKETQLQAGGKPLKVGSRAGPCATDWDGDGDLDLLVGWEDGSVSLFRNTGSATEPKLAAAVQLVTAGDMLFGAEAPTEVRRGGRAKICVADWNRDGKPDLLVGDAATQKPDRPEPTAEEQAEYERIRKELKPLRERSSEIITQLRDRTAVSDDAERRRLDEELSEVSRRISELQAKLPREYERHGWVWLFLRK